ncbi:hypothetical protein D3C72_1860540 [compost metagenome]
MSVGYRGQADMRRPFQRQPVGAIVCPFADGAGGCPLAIPFQVDAAVGAIGVARQQMVPIPIVPLAAMFVLRMHEVACLVIPIHR